MSLITCRWQGPTTRSASMFCICTYMYEAALSFYETVKLLLTWLFSDWPQSRPNKVLWVLCCSAYYLEGFPFRFKNSAIGIVIRAYWPTSLDAGDLTKGVIHENFPFNMKIFNFIAQRFAWYLRKIRVDLFYLDCFSSLELHLGYFILHPFWNVWDGIGYCELDSKNKMLKTTKIKQINILDT